MFRKILLSWLVLGFILAAGTAFANPPAMSDIHDEAALLAQGWQRITDGVLQRKLAGNKVESFAFGREGSEWMIERSEDRLGFLLEEYEKYPSDRLRKVILDLRRGIVQMKKTLEVSGMAAADMIGVSENLAGCDIQFGAHADAYRLYPGPGVGATADSYFYNNCFYWGVVDASVYVRATQNGITTGNSASQTREGENVSAYAALTLNGGEDCYSTAWSRSQSAGLGIIYETSDFNDDCPAPPLVLDITGPTYVSIYGYAYRTLIWNATVSGGVPPYGTINWYRDGYWVGSGGSYSDTFYGNNWNWTEYVNLYATVTDSTSVSASDSHTTTIRYFPSKICPIYEESSMSSATGDAEQIICPY